MRSRLPIVSFSVVTFSIVTVAALVLASFPACADVTDQRVPVFHVQRRDAQVSNWKQLARFIPVKDRARSCQAFTPPEAISERSPVGLENDVKARLNFVVTAEGSVNMVMVMQLDRGDERNLLDAVTGWRFHPALCDGVPTDAEANLVLESRR